METNQLLSPDHYLTQQPTREFTPALRYQSIILPLNGLDGALLRELADLMEWSTCSTEQLSNLMFVAEEMFNQIGDCFDHSHIQFMYNLQGNQAEGGNVPGYPSSVHLSHTPIVLPEIWPKFVTLFRYYSLEVYKRIKPFTDLYLTKDLVYQCYITGGLVFVIADKNNFYDLG